MIEITKEQAQRAFAAKSDACPVPESMCLGAARVYVQFVGKLSANAVRNLEAAGFK